ncbi:MAG: hypothetical protein AB7I27_00785 [Bacteriovoracaceae bacterium]
MKYLLQFLLWFLYFPLIELIDTFFFWIPALSKRIEFEKKNEQDPLCESFKYTHQKADLCFEFSSEGEYQQIAALVQDALSCHKKIELVFFSPSVEKAVVDLAHKFPDQIRYLRYPIARFSPFFSARSFSKWVSSHELILVRYDLFPDFLIWALNPQHSLKIIWATFKKERLKKRKVPFYKRCFFNAAKTIIFASAADQSYGKDIGLNGKVYDFRIEQIRRRVEQKENKFESHFDGYKNFFEILNSYPREKRLLFGNAWPSDLFLLKHLPDDYLIVIVPHLLNPDIIKQFEEGLKQLKRNSLTLTSHSQVGESQSYILNIKGILCELYGDFGKSYVGGGFGVSVHSILEPLVSGTDEISCGIVNHRSTEFDLAVSMDKLTVVKDENDFLEWLIKPYSRLDSKDQIGVFFHQYPEFRKDVTSC